MISIVIPLYNEEAVILETNRQLTQTMQGMDYELLYVNDGSRDATGQLVRELAAQDKHIRLLDFSRNFGHQTAITAGMEYATGDAVVIIDADLQDPPRVILQMIAKWQEGYQVVYGKRVERKGETLFKKGTAAFFYRLMRRLTDMDLPVDAGDFRLIDRQVRDELLRLPERNRYVRGLVSWVGFRQTYVEYVRDQRYAGETKYPLKKMVKFAIDGITSFSFKPLRLATYTGFLFAGASFLYLLVVLIQKMTNGAVVSGWASTVAINLFFNGIVLIILGLIGEYVGRIYDEVKGRPLFILKEKVGFDEDN